MRDEAVSPSTARLPSFLIIGAAKSGTTTLFGDLGAHRGIFFPVVKEPSDLTSDKVLAAEGRAAYAKLFAASQPGQLAGEASTVYTARPQFDGAAERARQVLGADLKLIYLVRDPIDRILSDHRYSVQIGKPMAPDINVAIRETPRLVAMSRYAYQVAPWIERFGADRIRIVAFERYVEDRAAGVGSLFEFLGLPADPAYALPDARNKTSDVVAARGALKTLVRSDLYRRTVRRLLPQSVRDLGKRLVGRGPQIAIEQGLTADSTRFLLDELGPDVEALHELAGWTAPVWPRFAAAESSTGTSARRAGDPLSRARHQTEPSVDQNR